MTKESKSHHLRRSPYAIGGATIGVTGGGLAAWVIVGDGKGPAVVAKHRIEYLPHRDHRAIDSTLGHDHGAAELVGGITDEDQDALSLRSIKLGLSDPGHVGGTT